MRPYAAEGASVRVAVPYPCPWGSARARWITRRGRHPLQSDHDIPPHWQAAATGPTGGYSGLSPGNRDQLHRVRELVMDGQPYC
jgi:hypothetical protein